MLIFSTWLDLVRVGLRGAEMLIFSTWLDLVRDGLRGVEDADI